jgi:hypothetical protein
VESDKDEFIPDTALQAKSFEQNLGAETVIVPGRNHFNGSEEPAVLAELTKLL